MSYSYAISGVMDVDQRWDALPGDGAMYCVPAAFVNWMYYFATHGRLTALPFVNGQANHIRRNIAAMGDYMDTDAQDGTSTSDAIDGLVDWSEDRNVPYLVMSARATDNDDIRYTSLRNLLQMGAHVVVGRGRYELDDGVFERIGGHAMTVVGLNRTAAGVITISVHNPNNNGSRTTQDPRHVQSEVLTEKTRNIEGDSVTILRWGADSVNPPYHCIDGWTALLPAFAVSNVTARALTGYTADIATGAIVERTFPLPFGDELADLALDPSGPLVSVIAKGSGEVWTLDRIDGTWTKVAGVAGAQRLVYGGRRQRLFVVAGREVTALDRDLKPVGRLDPGVALDAITYDAADNRIVGLGGDKLIALDPAALRVLGQVDAPEVAGAGRITLSANRRDRTVLISREGSPEVATARWSGSGRRFRLRTEGASAGAHVNAKGRVHVSDDRRIATFDADGVRVPGSVFDGLPAGPLLKVARSNNPLDPVRSRRKGWRD